MTLNQREKALVMSVLLKDRLSSMIDSSMSQEERQELSRFFSVITVKLAERLNVDKETLTEAVEDLMSSGIPRLALDVLDEIDLELEKQREQKESIQNSKFELYGDGDII